MPETLAAPDCFTLEEFLSPDNLQKIDDTLTEVFGIMLGFDIQPDEAGLADPANAEKVTAVIGFTGVARGSCEVSMTIPAALVIASSMLGGTPEADELADAIRDAASEICNLVAGGWKHRVDSLQSRLLLAPPTVMTGTNYQVHGVDSNISIARAYAFDGHRLSLTLRIEKE